MCIVIIRPIETDQYPLLGLYGGPMSANRGYLPVCIPINVHHTLTVLGNIMNKSHDRKIMFSVCVD